MVTQPNMNLWVGALVANGPSIDRATYLLFLTKKKNIVLTIINYISTNCHLIIVLTLIKQKVTSPNQLKISLLVVFTLLLSISLLNSAVPVLTFYFLLIFLYIIFTYSHPSFFSLIALGFQLSQCFFHSPHLSFLLVLSFVARR